MEKQNKKEGWGERFDNKFKCEDCDKFHFPHGLKGYNIKNFICQELQAQKNEIIEMIKESSDFDKKHRLKTDLISRKKLIQSFKGKIE